MTTSAISSGSLRNSTSADGICRSRNGSVSWVRRNRASAGASSSSADIVRSAHAARRALYLQGLQGDQRRASGNRCYVKRGSSPARRAVSRPCSRYAGLRARKPTLADKNQETRAARPMRHPLLIDNDWLVPLGNQHGLEPGGVQLTRLAIRGPRRAFRHRLPAYLSDVRASRHGVAQADNH